VKFGARAGLAVIASAFIAGSAWALWHALSHCSIWISVHDYGLATETLLYADPHDVTLELLDGEGKVLAVARTVEPDGYFTVPHPDPAISDCSTNEREASTQSGGRENYAQCYKQLSRWTSRWATSVQGARFTSPQCNLPQVPVKVTSDMSEWMLWWVPLPHVGGVPYRRVTLELNVDTRTCRAMPAL